MFNGWKRILPNGPFAPFFTFFFAFIGSAHGLPGNPVRLANVFSGSLPSLLVYQVTVTKRRFPVCVQFKKRGFSHKLVGRRDGIIARASNFPRAIFCKLIFAQLEKTDV